MLDDFCLEQPIAYRTLLNSIKKDKVSHAYLIETNGYAKAYDFAIAFAKYILCPKNKSNLKNCDNCNQCIKIDKQEFLELKIIDSSGQWIKKSQLDELQEEFSKKAIIGNKKVYIINKVEKLNSSSSNSLLKFLEEPEEGIIAILLVENKYKVLSTIISRCQVLSLKHPVKNNNNSTIENIATNLFNSEIEKLNFMSNEEYKIKILKVIEFVKFYENEHYKTIIYSNKLWHDNFKEKDEIYDAYTVLLLFYKDVLNLKVCGLIEVFKEYEEDIKKIEKLNNLNQLLNKIDSIIILREKIKYNANNNLMLDKLIIELEGSDKK